jgi:hypothetical protein
MCFNYRMGFEPEPSNNLGNEFLVILKPFSTISRCVCSHIPEI